MAEYSFGPSTTHNATVLTTSVHDLLLGTNNTERVRIDSSGHLLHGVTADEDTSGNGGLSYHKLIDIQIDGVVSLESLDQVINSTTSKCY